MYLRLRLLAKTYAAHTLLPVCTALPVSQLRETITLASQNLHPPLVTLHSFPLLQIGFVVMFFNFMTYRNQQLGYV